MSWSRLCWFFYIVFLSRLTNAQPNQIDSLSLLIDEVNDPISKVSLLNQRAFLLIDEELGKATRDVTEAMSIAKENGYITGIARSESITGSIHWAVGDYDRALASYFSALKDYESLGDSVGIAKIYNNLGEVNKRLGNYERSLELLKEAQMVAESITEPLTIYINLGELYTLLEAYDSAKLYFKKAAANQRILKSKSEFALTQLGFAEIYFKTDKLHAALNTAISALVSFQEDGNIRGQASSQFLLARIHFKLGNAKKSSNYFDETLKNAKAVSDRRLQMEVHKTLSEIFVKHRDFEGALEEYISYVAAKDSMISELKTAQIERLQAEYETDILLNDKSNAEMELRNRNIAILGTIMLLILSLAFVKVLISQRGRQRMINQTLEANNRKIEEQNEKIIAQSEQLLVLNENLKSMNDGLEVKIQKRTELLKKRNRTLEEYAYANAHELRAPVASILGLANLLENTQLNHKEQELLGHLKNSTTMLDDVLRSLREKLSAHSQD